MKKKSERKRKGKGKWNKTNVNFGVWNISQNFSVLSIIKPTIKCLKSVVTKYIQ